MENTRKVPLFRKTILLLAVFFLLSSFKSQDQPNVDQSADKTMKVESSAFEEGGLIPKLYTCDDKDISPSLSWDSVPDGTKSLALINDDPDAPAGTWVHWIIFNIPVSIKELPENIPPQKILENGAKQGTNNFRKIGYGGPCPPGGTHRYFFKLYALDTALDQEAGITKDQLLKAMEGHVLAEGQLMGKYSRK